MKSSLLIAGVALSIAAAAAFIGGWIGLTYLIVFAAATLPGWSLGRLLFGVSRPGGWIAGTLVGYGLTSLAIWVPIHLGWASGPGFFLSWATIVLLSFGVARALQSRAPLVTLPPWDRNSSLALALVILLAPALIAIPDAHIGQLDGEGGRRYRAYFTADFVWHEALTAELARFSAPPRNPYLASAPLHYYWSYFLLPAAVTGTIASRGSSPPVETFLAVNALCAGSMFLSAIFLAAWTAVRRPWAAATAVYLVVLAASAEGLYSVIDLWRRGASLDLVRGLNIDAITSWFFGGLTIDGLPRSLWYGPQHANSLALGLMALTIAAAAGHRMQPLAATIAGLCLGLGMTMSPFPAGIMVMTYGAAIVWDMAATPRAWVPAVGRQIGAVLMVLLALGWCVLNQTFEGAGGAVDLGLSRAATRRAFTILGLALGPVLVPTLAGAAVVAWRRFPRETRPAVCGVALAGLLFFFVTLVLEPIWIGWRAGAQFLVTAPALIAWALLRLREAAGKAITAAVVAVIFVIGFPTTAIDFYNAQDTTNLAMGPGFRWTVRLTPGEREALTWIETHTPSTALVQMSLEPRGRETWSLIPSFARRRMAAGLPISLLRTPDYDEPARRADRIFATPDPDEASRLARDLEIDFIYVGDAERRAFATTIGKFAERHDLFGTVFNNADATVYAVF